ncbi:hypothetical protein TRVL_04626 [Trypanosoma vivax]|nr:hypothetical protein TRVL_04626 [Trypanosoma vivax]
MQLEGVVSSDTVQCCECGAPAGSEGSLRAVLIVPCQHVLHAGCSEYIRRRRRAYQLLCACGDLDDIVLTATDPTLNNGHLVSCPTCQHAIRRLVPLYLTSNNSEYGDGSAGGNDNNNTAADGSKGGDTGLSAGDSSSFVDIVACIKQAHQHQKTHLAQLVGLCRQRERVTQLTRACALLHERHRSAQEEMQRLSRFIPQVDAPLSVNRLADAEMPVETMTATELELYITRSSAIIHSLERDVREQRRLVEKRRRRLNDLKVKCRELSLKENASEKNDGTDAATVACPGMDCVAEQRNGTLPAVDSTGTSNMGVRRSKRPRVPPIVDVDAENSMHKSCITILSSGSSDVSESDGDVEIIGHTSANTATGCGKGGRVNSRDVLLHRTQPVNSEDCVADVTVPGNSATYAEDGDLRWCTHLHRAEPVLGGTVQPSTIARLLPRRVDRLWQSSLEGLL